MFVGVQRFDHALRILRSIAESWRPTGWSRLPGSRL